VVSGLLQAMTGSGLGFFDLTWVGLPAAAVAILYFAFVGHRALPERQTTERLTDIATNGYHFELSVGEGSLLAGKTVEEAGLRALGEAYLAHIIREDHVVGPVGPHDVLQHADTLVFVGDVNWLDRLLAQPGLERATPHVAPGGYTRLPLFEAVVSDTSRLVGKTLREVGFRDQFGGVVLAIRRRGEPLTNALGRIPLKAGDLLLIEAREGFAEKHSASREDFFLVAPCRPGLPATQRTKAPLALGLFGVMVLIAGLDVVPLVTAAFVAGLGMIATGCLRLSEARQAVDLPVLLMIAAALGIGSALEATGLAAAVAGLVLDATAGLGPFAVIAALYLATNVTTELLTNAAAAALFVPVALAAAADLQIDPTPLAVAIAVAASAGFATPIGYQTHLMVMSAGSYRFGDFVRAGLPLNLIVMAVALVMIWLVWL